MEELHEYLANAEFQKERDAPCRAEACPRRAVFASVYCLEHDCLIGGNGPERPEGRALPTGWADVR